jgi:RhoGAP domain
MEGLFRVAGAEPVVQEYIAMVNDGTFECRAVLDRTHSREEKVHAVATLLVRWLGDLPKGILAYVPGVVMDRALRSLVGGLSPVRVGNCARNGML